LAVLTAGCAVVLLASINLGQEKKQLGQTHQPTTDLAVRGPPPENRRLDVFVGEWRDSLQWGRTAGGTFGPFPAKHRGISTCAWTLDGWFLKCELVWVQQDDGGEPRDYREVDSRDPTWTRRFTVVSYLWYDSGSKVYRSWSLSSLGDAAEATWTYDDRAKTWQAAEPETTDWGHRFKNRSVLRIASLQEIKWEWLQQRDDEDNFKVVESGTRRKTEIPQPPAESALQTRPASQPAARVSHFAVVCCGATHGSVQHQKWYWDSNERIAKMLREVYSYPDEAVYRLCEDGKAKDPGVDGRSSLANFRKVFAHLAKIMQPDDQLLVYLVGHGGAIPWWGAVYDLTDGMLTSAELARLLDALPTQNIVILLNPCNSGAFIPALSRRGRVICTSTRADEDNAAGWEGSMTNALARGADADGDGHVSLKEAYNASVRGTEQWYRNEKLPLQEHPLLDDNGDGVGHFGQDRVVEGDGELAAKTWLGDQGRPLRHTAAALQALAEANASLKLE
jgi:hypothetical protein